MEQHDAAPRERRHTRTRQGILEAALQVSREGRLGEISLREIARRADFSPAGLYRYFASKEEIIAALAQESHQRLASYLAAVPAALEPAERLVELGLAYLAFAREHPDRFRLLFTDLPSERRSLGDQVPPDSAYGILLTAADQAIRQGQVAEPPGGSGADGLAYAVWSLAHGMASLAQVHLQGFDADFAAVQRYALERLVHNENRRGKGAEKKEEGKR